MVYGFKVVVSNKYTDSKANNCVFGLKAYRLYRRLRTSPYDS